MTMIHITLPDGTVNEYAAGITCGEVITDAFGKKHGCLAAKIDGAERDLSHILNNTQLKASLLNPKRASTSSVIRQPTSLRKR